MDKRIEILEKQKPDYCDNDNKPFYNEDQVLAFGQEYAEWLAEKAFNCGLVIACLSDSMPVSKMNELYQEWLENFKTTGKWKY